MDSPFEVLGVDPDADDETIERAYRRRVKEAHPDHGGSVRAFQRVRTAYNRIQSGNWEQEPSVAPDDPVNAPETEEPEVSTVEFLNYEVLDDHGWALDDDDLFANAAAADLDAADYGRFEATRDGRETLLETAEACGFTWPYACRGGACANCAVAMVEGDLSMPVDHILPEELTDRGFRLSCVGAPTTTEAKVVFNVKHLPDLDDLRLPPRPFRGAGD